NANQRARAWPRFYNGCHTQVHNFQVGRARIRVDVLRIPLHRIAHQQRGAEEGSGRSKKFTAIEQLALLAHDSFTSSGYFSHVTIARLPCTNKSCVDKSELN